MRINTQFDKMTSQNANKGSLELKKYIPVCETDKQWGFVINDVGHATISRNEVYPPGGHPGTHRFTWEQGRILQEYHFVLITEGEGIFESKTAGIRSINAGDGFILFPQEWHRYKPVRKIGWTENWVGFSGQIPELIMKDPFFSVKQPVIQNCASMIINNLFKSLFRLILQEPFGYQRAASGICLQLIAEIYNLQKNPDSNKEIQSAISNAKRVMHQKIDGNFDFQDFCTSHRVSYSKFRADFRYQTGFAPQQYFLLIKMEKAKQLLINTDMKTKQIAFNLGFKFDHYFSRLFKAKTGFSPQEFRRKSGITI